MTASVGDQLRGLAIGLAKQALTAATGSNALTQWVDSAGVPPDLAKLESIVKVPDWETLAVLGLKRLADSDPHLAVGTRPEQDGWAKAITLTYSDGGQTATLALALFSAARHGLVLTTSGSFTAQLGSPNALGLSINSDGQLSWSLDLAGGPKFDATAAGCSATVTYHIPGAPTGDGLKVGPVTARVELATADPHWTLDLAFGVPAVKHGDPPVAAGIGLTVSPSAILGPAISSVVSLPDISGSFTPELAAYAATPDAGSDVEFLPNLKVG